MIELHGAFQEWLLGVTALIHIFLFLLTPLAADDLLALAALRNFTTAEYWDARCRWSSNPPTCSSYGIRCDGSGRVTRIDLGNCNITGTLPPEWSTMSALKHMHLHNNQLHGTLPYRWSNMSALQNLYLHNNLLAGTLPHQWSNMSALQILYLHYNQLHGTLPQQWSNLSGLQVLRLHNNLLAGALPHQWSSMSGLQHLYLHYNELTGTLPPEWSRMSALQFMYLLSNQLTGTLPQQWVNLSAILDIRLDSNHLTGTLPDQWASLPALQYVRLSVNQLTGTLPHQWSGMAALQNMYLHYNNLEGTLPRQWSNLSALRHMFLHYNTLTGTLPHQWSKMSELIEMRLDSNRFCGTIPAQWQSLPAATNFSASLDLRNNSFVLYPTAWYTAVQFAASVVVTTSKPAAFCSASASWSNSMTPVTTSTRSPATPTASISRTPSARSASLSRTAMSLSHRRSLTPTEHLNSSSRSFTPTTAPTRCVTATVTPSAHCDIQRCRIAASSNASSTLLSSTRVALLPASAGTVPPLHAAPVSYAAAHDATVFALRLVCGVYPFPLGVRDAVLLHNGAGLHLQQAALGDPDEMLLSLPSLHKPSWLPASALPFRANTIRVGLTLLCDGEVSLVVTVPVLPEPLSALASTTAAVSVAAQWVSSAAGASVAGSLGRAAAAQRVLLCSSMGSSYGGLLGLSIGGIGDREEHLARGAVVGNAVVLVAGAVVLLSVAFLYGAATGVDCRSSLLRVALPSSLLPVWFATLPTTSAALPLLVGSDVGFVVLGAAAVLLPVLLLIAVALLGCSGGFIIVECAIRSEQCDCCGAALPAVVTLLRRSLARQWRWQDKLSTPATPSTLLRVAWVVLLEYRVLWYPLLDAIMLTATCVLGVVSGMGDLNLCRSAGWAMLALCVAQLCVCLAARPMTSLASNVHCVSCLLLTCAALLVQCVGLASGESLPVPFMTAAVVLQLAVVGLSLMKSLDDVWNVVCRGLRLLTEMGLRRGSCAAAGIEPAVAADDKNTIELHNSGRLGLVDCQHDAEEDDEVTAGVASTTEVWVDPFAYGRESVPSRRLMLYEELADFL